MSRTRFLSLITIFSILVLSACVAPQSGAAPAAEQSSASSAEQPAPKTESAVDPGDSEAKFKEILQCVEKNFPAEKYTTNEFLPDPNAAWEPMKCDTVDKIRVGMPWVLNDEEAPWYNAIEKGFYKDVCLEVELVPGGPGIDHVQTLAGGAVDFAVSAAGDRIPAIVSSPTPADIVAIGTFLKHSPYIWLGLDADTPKDQKSNKTFKPEDFIGKKIGIQGGSEYIFDYIINKYNLPKDQIQMMEGGFTPDPLLVGAMDYIGAWIVNQPRLLEAQGYMNWTAFQLSEWGWDEYSDVLAARRETLEKNPDLVKRYLAATYQGVKFMLDNPEESAEISAKYGVDAQVTKEQALRRFQLQEALVKGSDDTPLMSMTSDSWNTMVASFIQYGQMSVEACK